jgi:post-segregation antitoxin (ccd killing protein)
MTESKPIDDMDTVELVETAQDLGIDVEAVLKEAIERAEAE